MASGAYLMQNLNNVWIKDCLQSFAPIGEHCCQMFSSKSDHVFSCRLLLHDRKRFSQSLWSVWSELSSGDRLHNVKRPCGRVVFVTICVLKIKNTCFRSVFLMQIWSETCSYKISVWKKIPMRSQISLAKLQVCFLKNNSRDLTCVSSRVSEMTQTVLRFAKKIKLLKYQTIKNVLFYILIQIVKIFVTLEFCFAFTFAVCFSIFTSQQCYFSIIYITYYILLLFLISFYFNISFFCDVICIIFI